MAYIPVINRYTNILYLYKLYIIQSLNINIKPITSLYSIIYIHRTSHSHDVKEDTEELLNINTN